MVERGIVYLYCYNISIEILEADINLNGYSREKKESTTIIHPL